MWLHWVLVAACRIFSCSMQTPSCSMWDLVPRDWARASCVIKRVRGPAACCSKANEEARLVGKETFILDAGKPTWEGSQDACPKVDLLYYQSVGKSFYKLREGVTWRNSTVNSDSNLEIGLQLSDLCHLECFKYSLSLVPRSVCFHFLRPILGIMAADAMDTIWSSCS